MPLDPLAGTHSAAEQNAVVHEQNAVGYASDTRSGTLIIYEVKRTVETSLARASALVNLALLLITVYG